jgi:hypothetical protein
MSKIHITQDDDKLNKKGGITGEDFENELQSSVSAFEALERDFQEVSCIISLTLSEKMMHE